MKRSKQIKKKASKRRFQDIPRLIGVIHLPALPGSPSATEVVAQEYLAQVTDHAVREARILSKAGFDSVVIENFGDAPFFKGAVPTETVVAMTVIGSEIRRLVPKVALGINVLRNDAFAALTIATMVGAEFIRVNVLSGVVASDQGIIEGQAAQLLRERARLHSSVGILGDVQVKHAQTLSSPDLEIALEEMGLRALADGAILSGATTGRAPSVERLQNAFEVTGRMQLPLYIGSGFSLDTAESVLPWIDGILVGSALREGGVAGHGLDSRRIKAIVQATRMLR